MKRHQCIVTVLARRRTIIIHHNQDIVEYTITIKVVGADLHKKTRFHGLFLFKFNQRIYGALPLLRLQAVRKLKGFILVKEFWELLLLLKKGRKINQSKLTFIFLIDFNLL